MNEIFTNENTNYFTEDEIKKINDAYKKSVALYGTLYLKESKSEIVNMALYSVCHRFSIENTTDGFTKRIKTKKDAAFWSNMSIYAYNKRFNAERNSMPVHMYIGVGKYKNYPVYNSSKDISNKEEKKITL